MKDEMGGLNHMKDEMGSLDIELKSLFMESKLDDAINLLSKQTDEDVKEMAEYNWNIVKKYYDTENFHLLFQHLKFVAYSCFIIEYAHKRKLISDDAFGIMMSIYNDIYELKRQQK